MTIGIDVSALQSGHRMRGIGYTLINLINNMPAEVKTKHSFVFYYYDQPGKPNPLELLNLEGISYEKRYLAKKTDRFTLPGKLDVFARLIHQVTSLARLYMGEKENVSGIDIFLQTDQMVGLPRGNFKKAFIAYDIIPYILEWDYLWNYKTARAKDLPVQAAIRCEVRRRLYIHKLKANVMRSDFVLAISETTREDFIKYVGRGKKKIKATPLGINPPTETQTNQAPQMHRYVKTSWGYMRRPYKFHIDTPFVLFVGGADQRRKLAQLVLAFNQIRAGGHELKLVLAGDTMQGPSNIPVGDIKNALEDSSYIEDIVFMGFVDDKQRDWLYKNAAAFVYPSVYEGFGLPVLEAFSYKCPVIAYPNRATFEIAKESPLYAKNSMEIRQHILSLLINPETGKKIAETGYKQSKKYQWAKTAENIFNSLVAL